MKVLGRRESERSTQWRFLELWPACEVQTATDEALLDAIFYFTVIQHDFFFKFAAPSTVWNQNEKNKPAKQSCCSLRFLILQSLSLFDQLAFFFGTEHGGGEELKNHPLI